VRRLRTYVAAFLAPAPLLMFICATADRPIPRRPAYVIAGVATAHLILWVPYFTAKIAGILRRLRAQNRPTVPAYATSVVLLSCSFSVIVQRFHDQFSWAVLVRDSTVSLAAVGSYIFYLAIAQKPAGANPVTRA